MNKVKKFMVKTCVFVVILLGLAVYMDQSYAACRSSYQVKKFKRLTGYPNGRKGYVVDHKCSLFNGGIDKPSNMQWQTILDSKAKDKVENTQLGKQWYCDEFNSTKTRQVFNCK